MVSLDTNFTIEEMRRSDIDAVSIIEEECFSLPWSKRSLLEAFSHTPWAFFVARVQKKVVGYGGVYLILDEGQISNIAVLPAFRHMGIGQAILERIISHCNENGASKITLELRESNNAAYALYEKLGFFKVGARPNYYQNPTESAILMDKDLK